MIEICKEHLISGKFETIENAVTPIIQQLNRNGLPIDIGVVEKIRNRYLEDQKVCAEKIFSLAGSKFDPMRLKFLVRSKFFILCL